MARQEQRQLIAFTPARPPELPESLTTAEVALLVDFSKGHITSLARQNILKAARRRPGGRQLTYDPREVAKTFGYSLADLQKRWSRLATATAVTESTRRKE